MGAWLPNRWVMKFIEIWIEVGFQLRQRNDCKLNNCIADSVIVFTVDIIVAIGDNLVSVFYCGYFCPPMRLEIFQAFYKLRFNLLLGLR